MLAGFFGFLDFFGFFFAATARPSGNSDEGERESVAMGLGHGALGPRLGQGAARKPGPRVRRVGDQPIRAKEQFGLNAACFQFERHDIGRRVTGFEREQMPRPSLQRLSLLGAELVALINRDDASE